MSRRQPFLNIRTEGALLPTDLLARLLEGANLPGLKPEDYHLGAGEKLNEAISRSWTRLLSLWASFRKSMAALPSTDLGTTLTREKWLLQLFQELGYGRLIGASAFEIDGKSYLISHLWHGQHYQVPLHLVSFRAELDKRSDQRIQGASKASPHGLVQEFLNRSEPHLWAIVSNGLRLRILRDNASLTRQAHVEFDLEGIFEGEAYADFRLLWMVCHQSRLEGTAQNRPETCWLEAWSKQAQTDGRRALDHLRDGVQKALETLGTGFIAHKGNQVLRDRLQAGDLRKEDLYRQLLRLAYRLIFLFVAEDRDLLHMPGATEDARSRYARFYSGQRLRRMSERTRGGRHSDLWVGLRLVFTKLGDDHGCPDLGLPSLGGFLFGPESIPDLESAGLANEHLLLAIRNLGLVRDQSGWRLVDYRNLGSEELGSIYESLLELSPTMELEAGVFQLNVVSGSERKTTGSYYTPDSLIQCLLDSSLAPVLMEASAKPNPERAILRLKVCDPACGSGHFLIAAAHRIARRLAAVRTGEEAPSPESIRTALRDVIGHCLYGVDLNPMAIELCKVSLWLEALEPGKPLSFLDHHLQWGNSLLTATPELLAEGIPDAAFKAIEGDDSRACTRLRTINQGDRGGFGPMFRVEDEETQTALLRAASAIDDLPDDRPEHIHQKERRFRDYLQSEDFQRKSLLADAWCSAFMIRKLRDERTSEVFGITQGLLNSIATGKEISGFDPHLNEIHRLSGYYKFFHWHLQFPEVFAQGGFDLVLGNPPWDSLSPDRREFFGAYIQGLRALAPAEQDAAIDHVMENPSLAGLWERHCRDLFALVHFLKSSGVFTLFAKGNLGKGDFNVYRMFVETALRRTRPGGYASMVVPGGLYGGANASAIRKHLFDECQLEKVFGLINTQRGWFAEVDIDRFAAFSAKVGGRTREIQVQFGLAVAEDLENPSVLVNADTIRSIAPDTYAIPDVRDLSQLVISNKMNDACPPFGAAIPGTPRRHYSAELHMGNNRDLFTTSPDGLPVYEGRMIDNFDHRAKTYVSGHGNSAVWTERPFGDPEKSIVPQWRVLPENVPGKLGNRCDRYRIGFGDVANPRNERSFVAALIPPSTICGDKVPTFDFDEEYEWAYLPWLAVANSLAMDWMARTRLTSAKMALSLLDGLPFPRPKIADPLFQDTASIVLRLICTSPEMTPFWNKMAALGVVPSCPDGEVPASALVNPEARESARALLDAYVAKKVFGLEERELSEILDTFGVLFRREMRTYQEFRTKRLILDAFNSLV